jgi:hypothetical protein
MLVLLLLISWGVSIWVAQVIGAKKHRAGWAWGLCLGWIGVVIVAVMQDGDREVATIEKDIARLEAEAKRAELEQRHAELTNAAARDATPPPAPQPSDAGTGRDTRAA